MVREWKEERADVSEADEHVYVEAGERIELHVLQ